MSEYFWTINGNRWVRINEEIFPDFISYEMSYKKIYKSAAQIYLETMGFSDEEALEYLNGLLPKGE